MKNLFSLLFCLFLSGSTPSFSQSIDSTEVFFLTCSPGKEVLTIYGHSAIRIVRASIGYDQVYSWGVYDFSAPNFYWNFAMGRLKYKIDSDSYNIFLQAYFFEQRTVYSQKINLTSAQKEILLALININMQPENKLYLYDFFYDNCSTRVRDIIEKIVRDKLIYPKENSYDQPTFRGMINVAQKPIPWLTFGTDMLIGIPGDYKAGFRDQMFLPESLMKNLSLLMINDSARMIPLLQKPVAVLDFNPSTDKVILTPFIVFSLLFLIIALLSFLYKRGTVIDYIDKFLFFTFSILTIMIVFFNFFTDHQAMKMNLNIIWLNPLLVAAFVTLFMKKEYSIWFRLILIASLGFLVSLVIIPQTINVGAIPIILILIIRSFARSKFSFPFRLKQTK
jgi:hypothetical protein